MTDLHRQPARTTGLARRCPLLALLAILALAALARGADEAATNLLRTGQYEEAIELLAGEPGVESVDELARAYIELGRYEEAEEALRRLEAEEGFEAWTTLGEVLLLRGRLDEARTQLETAIRRRAGDALAARYLLATVDRDQGRWPAAREGFYSLIDAYNRRSALSSAELTAVGRACQALGNEDHQLFKDALRAFDEAVAADPGNLEPRVALGELFLEKYDSTEARASISAVLEVNPRQARALLLSGRILHFDGSYQAMEMVDSALEVNPNLVDARIFKAELHLELEEFDEAEAEAERALEVNPRALEALAVLAAADFLRGDEASYSEHRDRVLSLNPRAADFFILLADAAVRNRLYAEAVDFARQGVALDEKSWRAHGLEGLNLLRVGEIEGGTAKLERAFAGDPYNVWIKNTLDLIDTFPEYHSTSTPRFELFIHGDESDLLAPYMEEVAEEAYEALAERYRFEPPTPLRVEVFPSHADFSVRTVGLAGLGALGVCFGPVIAVDSPSAREIGSFNWASTLWHEIAHTFTLMVSGHKVPRWLTEGLSVLEERRARVGWGDDPRPDFLQLLAEEELLPLSEINNGFVRPSYPGQLGHSYYQASLIVEMIEDLHGFDKILAILHGYRDGKSTEEIFEQVLGQDLESFDESFFAHLEARFGSTLAALDAPDRDPPGSREELAERAESEPGNFRAQLSYGTTLYAEERSAEAVPFLERAKELFPEYAYEGNAYWLLAQIHRQNGDLERAVEELERLVNINENDYRAHRELAELYGELGEPAAQAAILERALTITPLERDVHRRLAELYEELGERQGVIRERAAVVALRPPDRADALYRLALAYQVAGEGDMARRQVLRALEIAPTFGPAQELLLTLHRGERE